MLKKVYILFLILFFSVKLGYSQDSVTTIKGKVVDVLNKKPLPGANVFIRSLNIGAESDINGEFIITHSENINDIIEISYISYKSKKISISVKLSEIKTLTVYLEPSENNLDEIQITTSRNKQTVFDAQNFVTITTREEIENKSHQTTAELLIDEPGILIQKTTYAHGAPVIRGLLGKYVLLMYNGIRLNKPTFRFGANQYMNTINSDALGRIEVTRGPASVLYGSDALGGTINMIADTYRNYGQGFKIDPTIITRLSSADGGRDASFNLKGGNEKFAFSSNVNIKNVENVKPGGGHPEQNPTGWDEKSGNLNLYYQLKNNQSLEADIIYVDQNNIPRYDKYETGEYQKWIYHPQKRQLYSLSYLIDSYKPFFNQIKFNVSYQNEDEGRTQQKTNSLSTRIDNDNIKTFGSFLQFSSIFKDKHWLTWGAEYYRDRVESRRDEIEIDIIKSVRGAFPNGSIYNSFGLYLQETFLVNENNELGAGIRYSRFSYSSPLEQPWGYYKDNFSNVTGSVNYKYKLTSQLNMVSSVSRGFRAPNFNDMVVLQVSNSGFDAPNPNLKPEISMNYEMGLKLDSGDLKGAWFIYYNRMSDLLDRRLGTYKGLWYFDENLNSSWDVDEPQVFVKKNVGEANIYGTEFHLSKQINSLMLSGQIFYTYGENITEDEPLSRIPPLTGSLRLKYNFKDKKWVELNSIFASKQDRLSQRDILDTRIPDGGTSGYKIFNMLAGFDWGNRKIVLRFENLFDEYYKTHGSGVYAAGRNLSIMFKFKPFNNN